MANRSTRREDDTGSANPAGRRLVTSGKLTGFQIAERKYKVVLRFHLQANAPRHYETTGRISLRESLSRVVFTRSSAPLDYGRHCQHCLAGTPE